MLDLSSKKMKSFSYNIKIFNKFFKKNGNFSTFINSIKAKLNTNYIYNIDISSNKIVNEIFFTI